MSDFNAAIVQPIGYNAESEVAEEALTFPEFSSSFGFIVPMPGKDHAAVLSAAAAANPGKLICLVPEAVYTFKTKLRVTAHGTKFYGFGSAIVVNATDNDDAFHFECPTSGQWDYLNLPVVEGIKVQRNTPATEGAAVRLTRCNGGRVVNVQSLNCPEGIVIEGGQDNTLECPKLYASSDLPDLTGVANSSLLRIVDSPTDGGTYQPAYTVKVISPTIGAGGRVQTAVMIGQVDGLQWIGGYVSKGAQAVMRLKALRDSSYISGVTVGQCYLDGISTTTGSVNLVHIPDDGFANSRIYSATFTGCEMGNCAGAAIYARKRVELLGIDGGVILNTAGWALDYAPSAKAGTVTLAGTRLLNIGTAAGSTGACSVSNAAAFAASPSILSVLGTGAVYAFSGTVDTTNVGGTVASFAGTLVSRSGTQTAFNFGPMSSSAVSFTPSIRFGGATTGIAGTQTGTYGVVAGRCIGDLTVALSSKGSATGVVDIAGLPFVPAGDAAVTIHATAITSGVGDTMLIGFVSSSTGTIRLFKLSAGAQVQLTEADLTASSVIRITFNYRI